MKKFNLFILSFCLLITNLAWAAEDALPPKQMKWSFDGPLGTFDKQSIQRGFQVYREVCAACHSMNQIFYRNLVTPEKTNDDPVQPGIGLSADEVKALASQIQVTDGPNDAGDMFTRPGTLADRFPSPFKNEQAARSAHGGAYPPDLSLIIKARKDGANYLHSLLTGYNQDPPKDLKIGDNATYNPYFPGKQIAMPAPLSDEQVTYADGTKATVDQMSRDVVNFLQWAAEPEMEARKHMGIRVMLFLAIFTICFYYAKCRVWNRLKNLDK